jgi:SAM-dependent methyltransferase
MHDSARENGKNFFEIYTSSFTEKELKIVEVGSQNVNGSLKSSAPENCEYIGLDFEEGRGVDIVLKDAYSFPLEDNSVDIVVSSSCFEHAELFWLTYLEIMRILKPKGIFYLNVPTQGHYHGYPADCWRFYPDSGKALISWGKRNNYNNVLLESYVDPMEEWNDFVGVFLKDESCESEFLKRISDTKEDINHIRSNK